MSDSNLAGRVGNRPPAPDDGARQPASGPLARLLRWLLVSRSPRDRAELALLLSLPLLALLGALALSWPWLTTEAPRLLAAGFEVARAWLADLLGRLLEALPRPGQPG